MDVRWQSVREKVRQIVDSSDSYVKKNEMLQQAFKHVKYVFRELPLKQYRWLMYIFMNMVYSIKPDSAFTTYFADRFLNESYLNSLVEEGQALQGTTLFEKYVDLHKFLKMQAENAEQQKEAQKRLKEGEYMEQTGMHPSKAHLSGQQAGSDLGALYSEGEGQPEGEGKRRSGRLRG